MTRFVAVDFFCGAGGMTSGLISAGIHVLAGVDNQPLCEATYLQDRNADGTSPEFLCRDVFPCNASHPGGEQHIIADEIDELLRNYRRRTGLRKLKLVFAICAPCQPFTKITKIKISNTRQFKRGNDANLLLTTIHLIKRFRPAAIVCENVEGIGDGPASVLATFREELAAIGYGFEARVVNAAKFGVPQYRKRTIGIGFDRRVYEGEFKVMTENPSLDKCVNVHETIGSLPPIAAGEVHPTLPNHRARALSDLNLKRISCALPGENNQYLTDTPYGNLSLVCHRNLAKRQGAPSFSDTYTRMRGDDAAPTITTKFISITNGRFGHYDTKQNRAITPREAALLQTFPEKYVFHPEDNIEFTAALIGNAVPPRLAEFFGRYIVARLG